MKFLILLFVSIPLLLRSSSNAFYDDNDPVLFQHVNVISGQLSLTWQDTVVQGGVPLPLTRTYSSSGAFRNDFADWIFKGGWSILPHTRIFVNGSKGKDLSAYVPEKGGNVIKYRYREAKDQHIFLTPKSVYGKASGNLSPRHDHAKNVLKLNYKRCKATLTTADGSKRYYRGNHHSMASWYLDYEILPSKHKITYTYKDQKLSDVYLQNPAGTKILSSVHFDHSPKEITASTSDQKSLNYQLVYFKSRPYINQVTSNFRPQETYFYQPGRKGLGGRVNGVQIENQEQFSVTYHVPSNNKKEKQWAEKIPKKKRRIADKIAYLEAPIGPDGQKVKTAQFTYHKDYTDVLDVEGCLTRYHHTGKQLSFIEYFDKYRRLHSTVKFFWENGNLICKALYGPDDKALFAKTFHYSKDHNISKECFWGNFSGGSKQLQINHQGQVIEPSEVITKRYKYERNLPIEEREEGGLTHQFQYIPDTDLIQARFTLKEGKIFLREFYYYDQDNLLIHEISDDGRSKDPTYIRGMTERHSKYYQRAENGLCTAITECYVDKGQDKQLSHRTFSYDTKNQVIAETHFDAQNLKLYTLYTDYNDHGQVIRKTTPLGQANSYSYDPLGRLITCQEIGKLTKHIQYDQASRPICCIETDGITEKITRTTYDLKGRALSETDHRGHITRQDYDSFGNCHTLHFPMVVVGKKIYHPVTTFKYDLQGNLIAQANALGHQTTTQYNTLHKPTLITNPDGGQTRHLYSNKGHLLKTIYPDGTEEHYRYDAQQRVTSKTIYSTSKEVLQHESWTYNTLHLISYTNPAGLTTTYTYDSAGRKIQETAQDRTLTYSYSSLGQLEKATYNGQTQVVLYDVEGKVTAQWQEDQLGTIENKMTFFYNAQGRKEKAIRITSQGEAIDTFKYDTEGRLIQHTDPLGEVSTFQFAEITSTVGQRVLQTTQINPLGHATIETYDSLNRLIQTEKRSADDKTVAKEELLYNEIGNLIETKTTLYKHNTPIDTYSVKFQYDSCARVVQQIEADHKVTSFSYDKKGRLITKTKADQTTLHYLYDGLDRLVILQSSDNHLFNKYHYGPGSTLIHTHDAAHHLVWNRTYNIFGELTSETAPNGSVLTWDYTQGKCSQFTLPDQTYITYDYSDLHLTKVTRKNATSEYSHTYTHFDPNGHVAQEELIQNLGSVSTTHDLLERPLEQTNAWNTNVITYGPSGLVTQTLISLLRTKDYTYDPLDQLRQEGNKTHDFDSLGNPIHAQVNKLNQITSTPTSKLAYDLCGNPTTRHTSTEETTYTYDPLNRLTSIETADKKVKYQYDTFGRLYSKDTLEKGIQKTQFYLYDHDTQIGSLDQHNTILDLKILGLGISGDIGAAVAIEIGSEVYAPLHDFAGNIIAILCPDGTIKEKYEISAFGEETSKTTPINPWRFNSKRSEEGLVYFGERFYDPILGRWLTPDPADAIDSANLYLYVRNSPMNRLDVFGLESYSYYDHVNWFSKYNSPTPTIPQSGQYKAIFPTNPVRNEFGFIRGKAQYGVLEADLYLSDNYWDKIKFTAEEIEKKYFDLLDHLPDIVPRSGKGISFISGQNGIYCRPKGIMMMGLAARNNIDGDPLIMLMCNISDGVLADLFRTFTEARYVDTFNVILKRAALEAFGSGIYNINPLQVYYHFDHSGAAAGTLCAISGMSQMFRSILAKNLHIDTFNPAIPIPKDFAAEVTNFYSSKDRFTIRYALHKGYEKDKNYDIRILPSLMKKSLFSFMKMDHKFSSDTQQVAFKNQAIKRENEYEFIKSSR